MSIPSSTLWIPPTDTSAKYKIPGLIMSNTFTHRAETTGFKERKPISKAA
jgi:hypothetical protein